MEPTAPGKRCPACGKLVDDARAVTCPECHALLAAPHPGGAGEAAPAIPRDPFAPAAPTASPLPGAASPEVPSPEVASPGVASSGVASPLFLGADEEPTPPSVPSVPPAPDSRPSREAAPASPVQRSPFDLDLEPEAGGSAAPASQEPGPAVPPQPVEPVPIDFGKEEPDFAIAGFGSEPAATPTARPPLDFGLEESSPLPAQPVALDSELPPGGRGREDPVAGWPVEPVIQTPAPLPLTDAGAVLFGEKRSPVPPADSGPASGLADSGPAVQPASESASEPLIGEPEPEIGAAPITTPSYPFGPPIPISPGMNHPAVAGPAVAGPAVAGPAAAGPVGDLAAASGAVGVPGGIVAPGLAAVPDAEAPNLSSAPELATPNNSAATGLTAAPGEIAAPGSLGSALPDEVPPTGTIEPAAPFSQPVTPALDPVPPAIGSIAPNSALAAFGIPPDLNLGVRPPADSPGEGLAVGAAARSAAVPAAPGAVFPAPGAAAYPAQGVTQPPVSTPERGSPAKIIIPIVLLVIIGAGVAFWKLRPHAGSPETTGTGATSTGGAGGSAAAAPVQIYWRPATATYLADHPNVSRRTLARRAGRDATLVRVDLENNTSKPLKLNPGAFSLIQGGHALSARSARLPDLLRNSVVAPYKSAKGWLAFPTRGAVNAGAASLRYSASPHAKISLSQYARSAAPAGRRRR